MEIGETVKAETYYKRSGGRNTGDTDAALKDETKIGQKKEEAGQQKDDFTEGEGNVSQEMLQKIVEAYKAGNIGAINAMVHQAEYMEIADGLQAGESIYCGENGADSADGLRNGIGVAVHRIEGIATFYVGEWKDGKRDGQAYWSGDKCYWVGNWKDDLPNGKMRGTWYKEKLLGEPVTDEDALYFYSEGNVVDGLWDGGIISSDIYEGEQYKYSMTFDKGIVRKLWEEPDEYGDYFVGFDSDKNSYTVYDQEEISAIWGVWGFAEMEDI